VIVRDSILSIGVFCVVTLLVGGIQPVFACLGGLLDVTQPMVDPEGIWVSTVTYERSCLPSTIIPGYEITFVGKPNCVALENQPEKCGNLNAASLLGITATIDSIHGLTNQLLGDTLHAIIDLSGLKPMTEELEHQLFGWSVDAVVKATVESVLLTAYNHRTGISHSGTGLVEANYLWLEIRGSADYHDLAQVYSFDALGRLPRRRKFW
jgi:hypothetical protein